MIPANLSTVLTDSPPLSVLLAVYNGQAYLREAVESVLAQSFTDFEFIIIDDGSTDQSLPILREFALKDSRIRLVTRPNQGLTRTLNEGIGLARGDFLARMDADDLCLPRRFELQVQHLRQHPDCVLVGSAVEVMDSDGMPIRTMCSETTHEQIDAAHLQRGWPVVHPAVTMRTAAVRQAGGYRDQYNTLEDLDLFLRLAEIGKLANLPEVLLRYRQHFASVTHSKEARQLEIRQAIYDETRQRRGLPPEAPVPLTRSRPRTRAEQHERWAWSALKAGHIPTARKHAWQTIRFKPFAVNSWKLIFSSMRGH